MSKIRAIAFYLPQYHPIPENDEWWGKGFTEWTNVAKAKPLFKGHYQPHIPADLGFYDLRVPEVRESQAEMAKKYGIEGFCYWHYWFGNGKTILERPFNEVVKSGKPEFPFCLAWANETWSGIWHGNPKKILIEQSYQGKDDYLKHFYFVLDAFKDIRYIRVQNKPIFIIYRPQQIPDIKYFINLWQDLAIKEGLNGIHFIMNDNVMDPQSFGYDATINTNVYFKGYQANILTHAFNKVFFILKNEIDQYNKITLRAKKIFKIPNTCYYEEYVKNCNNHKLRENEYPILIPNWDNTPRSGYNGIVLKNSCPELFQVITRKVLKQLSLKEDGERILFIKSWNEWAEGNHLEPDLKFGTALLEILQEELNNVSELY
jgi:hypothetical protein